MKFKYHKDFSLIDNIRWTASDVWRSFKNFLVRVKYHYNGGYLCHECGVKIPIFYLDIKSVANGKTFLFSNYSRDNHLYCRHCLAEKVDAFMLAADLDAVPCDWHHNINKTIGVIGPRFGSKKNQALARELDLDVRFGCGWWNGHHASRHAMIEALLSDKAKYSTGVSRCENGNITMIDRYGIELEGNPF